MGTSLLTEVVGVVAEHIGKDQSQSKDINRSVNTKAAAGQVLVSDSGEEFRRQEWSRSATAMRRLHEVSAAFFSESILCGTVDGLTEFAAAADAKVCNLHNYPFHCVWIYFY